MMFWTEITKHEGLVTDRHQSSLPPHILQSPHQPLPPDRLLGLRLIGESPIESLIEWRQGSGEPHQTGRNVEQIVGLSLQQARANVLRL